MMPLSVNVHLPDLAGLIGARLGQDKARNGI
jgi:hypothetical protein